MKFLHILGVIFVTSQFQGVECHQGHRVRISSQMHLNAMEYIMACERTQRMELRKEKSKRNHDQGKVKVTKTTEKIIAIKQVRNRQKWLYYDLFLL